MNRSRLVCAGLLAFVLLATVWSIAVRPTPYLAAVPDCTRNPRPPACDATPAPTATPVPTPVPTPPPSGCPAGRVFLEAQSWWKDASRPSDAVGEHTHVGTCFPWGAQVSGTVSFDVRVLTHNNPGSLIQLIPQVWYGGGNRNYPAISLASCGSLCNVTVNIDTTLIPVDGWQEFRFFTQLRHSNGDEQHTSTGWQLYLDNGEPVDHYRTDTQADRFTEGRGWYTGTEYTVGRYSSPYFQTARSGTWTFNVDLKEGAGGTPVTFHAVYIDPDFHNGSSGITVRSGSGSFIGSVSIDTTTLSNGPHKLLLRADSQVASGRNSGLQVIPFEVQN